MFSIARRGVTLCVLVIGMMAMVVGSSQADGVIVPPWDCVSTEIDPQNNAVDENPVVTADYVVWEAQIDGYAYGIFVQKRSTGVVTQITNNTSGYMNPQIDGKYVVWQYNNPLTGTWDIARHHLPTGKTRVHKTSGFDDKFPQIEGNYIIWQRTQNGVGTVGIYNIATGVESRLGYDGGSTDFVPYAISGAKILYLRTTGVGDTSVEVYDIATNTIESLSNGLSFVDNKEELAIHGDMVVWRSKPGGHLDSAYEIYAYNLATDTLTQVTNDYYEDKSPAVFGHHIVFVRVSGSSSKVFHYDLLTGVTNLLADMSSAFDPVIDGTMVAWTGGADITIYDLAEDESTQLGFTAQGKLFIHGNQLFYGRLMSGETSSIFRTECGYVSNTIDLPESSASRSLPDALPTPDASLIPLP
jgi:Tol biopolymer transport system component